MQNEAPQYLFDDREMAIRFILSIVGNRAAILFRQDRELAMSLAEHHKITATELLAARHKGSQAS